MHMRVKLREIQETVARFRSCENHDERPSVGSLNRQARQNADRRVAPVCHRLLHLKMHRARPSSATQCGLAISSESVNGRSYIKQISRVILI